LIYHRGSILKGRTRIFAELEKKVDFNNFGLTILAVTDGGVVVDVVVVEVVEVEVVVVEVVVVEVVVVEDIAVVEVDSVDAEVKEVSVVEALFKSPTVDDIC
jgi:hypothetical protein